MKVHYKSSILQDLERLAKPNAKKILDQIEQNLAQDCLQGISTSEEFKNLLGYKIDDYRIIFTQVGNDLVALRIGCKKID